MRGVQKSGLFYLNIDNFSENFFKNFTISDTALLKSKPIIQKFPIQVQIVYKIHILDKLKLHRNQIHEENAA